MFMVLIQHIMVLNPYTLFIDYFFIQNLQHFYPKLLKTRRYKSMLKFALTPKLFCLLVENSIFFCSLNKFSFLFLTKPVFFLKQVFFLYKSLLFKDLGLATSTLIRSYSYWCIKSHLGFLLKTPTKTTVNQNTNLTEYSTGIQFVGYALKKKTFSKIIMYILFNFIKLNPTFLNRFSINKGYVCISGEFNFLYFYNFFYFKIHNY